MEENIQDYSLIYYYLAKFAVFIPLSVIATVCLTQVRQPAKWSFKVKKLVTDQFEIRLIVSLSGGWRTYSQFTPDGGPLPSRITFTKNSLLLFEGSVKEVGNMKVHFEKMFGVEVKQYADKVTFVQVVKLKKNGIKTSLTGDLTYMVCNDSQCLPLTRATLNIPLN